MENKKISKPNAGGSARSGDQIAPQPEASAFARPSKRASSKPRMRISAKRKRMLAFGRVCELTGGRAVLWRRHGIGAAEAFRLHKAGDIGYFAYLEYMRSVNPREAERVKSAARRPLYYEAENARRRALAEERRKVRARRTTSACPTAAEIMAAWERVGESHEATLRFGSLLEDLECYVDNSLKFNEEGDIVGRNQGIKGWLHDNAPILYDHYTTVMRYKAMSKKLRQIAELKDPVSASAVLVGSEAACDGAVGANAGGDGKAVAGKRDYAADEIAEWSEGDSGRKCAYAGGMVEGGESDGGNGARMEVPDVAIVRARAIWREVIGGIADNPTALVRRIDELVDPERVEDATMLAEWKAKYNNEITLRTKSKWWRKLKEKVG